MTTADDPGDALGHDLFAAADGDPGRAEAVWRAVVERVRKLLGKADPGGPRTAEAVQSASTDIAEVSGPVAEVSGSDTAAARPCADPLPPVAGGDSPAGSRRP